MTTLTGKYSFSKFDTYDKCPLAYKLEYLVKVPRLTSDALVKGKITHEIIGTYINHLIRNNRMSDLEELRRLTVQLINGAPDQTHPDIEDVIDRFANTFIFNLQGEIDTELELAFNQQWEPVEWLARDVFFRAKIDMLNKNGDQVYIIDWKTDRSMPAPSAAESSLQLRTYAYIASLLAPGAEQLSAQFFYLRYGAKRTHTFCRDEISHIPELIKAKAETIEKEKKFETRLNPNCGWCNVRHHCEAYQQLPAARIVTIETEEEALRAAQTYAALAGLSSDFKNSLEAWVDQHGPITIGKERLDFYPVEKMLFEDGQALTGFLLRNGLTKDRVWQALYTSKTKLKEVLKKARRMDLWIQLESLAQKKFETHFEFRKVKED